ncbi:DUF2790 domain-containing protein [Pseudomonas sp. NA-150]|uniref:DUF2790 domain-containing protein n=1 Tax=Pseudomonas sp. NA-150 TaxID=3367525 RepID=UPI0037C9FA96
MNSKAIYAACLFAALNICTLSARAESTVKTEAYSHGSQLDTRHVVSEVDSASSSCGVVNAHLTYQNSQGQTKGLDYLTFAEVCNQGG